MNLEPNLQKEAESTLLQLGPDDRKQVESFIRHLEGRIAFLESKNQRAVRDRAAVHALLMKTSEDLIRKYQTLFEYSGTAMVVIETDGTISLANSNWENLMGYTLEEVKYKRKLSDFFEEQSRRPLLEYHQRLLRGDQDGPSFCEGRIITKAGKVRDVTSRIGIFPGTGQGITSIIDITESKRAEDALKESEEKYRAFFTTSRDCVFITTAEGRWIGLNDAAMELFGYDSIEELMQVNVQDIYANPGERALHLDIIRQKGFSKDFPVNLKKKDGTVINSLITTVIRNDKNGTIIGFQGTIRDITERKRAEEALKESEQKFRDIFNNTTDAIHIHGIGDDWRPGKFTDVNDVACRMLGYSREEMLAKTPLDIATGYHNPPLEKIFEAQRTTGVARFETEYRRKDGTTLPVEVNTHVVTIQGKKVMLGVVRDITERKKAEALLKHFNEELEQEVKIRTEELNASLDEKVILLREVHHRVKNNLQIIISLVNLQMRQIDDKRLKQVMAETQNRVRAMSFVHEKLYQSEDISHIDLASYTRFLVTQLFSFYGIDSRQVALNVDIGKIMLDIETAIPLGLIINELASNALKHAFPNGRTGTLSITVRKDDKTLHLTVKDDGIGVPADFDWQHAESLGLQLTILLVDQLDGTIELDRRSGTAFTIVVKEKE